MSSQPVRFLHSGHWQLERPVGGVADVPTELRDALQDAPYTAAERVVQAAIDQRVDFLLLTGDILAIENAAPFSFEFLLRQFQRLADAQIAVYWLGGRCDDLDLWPAQLDLPKNVVPFAVGSMQELQHQRDGKVIVRLLGQSWQRSIRWRASDYAGTSDGVPRVAACYGTDAVSKRSLANQAIDYWALAGEPHHRVVVDDRTTAVIAGSPQGRRPHDALAHGAVLVEIDQGQVATRLIETDIWRWRQEEVHPVDTCSIDALKSQLIQQLPAIDDSSASFGWLVAWQVVCRGPLAMQLQQPEQQAALLTSLQKAADRDGRWPLDVRPVPARLDEELAEEDTILGDFLRSVNRFRADDDAWGKLSSYLPEGESTAALQAVLQQGNEESRQQLWQQVATWGADLLQGNVVVEG